MAYPSPFFFAATRFIGVVSGIIGIALAFLGFARIQAGWGSEHWPRTRGTIVRSEIAPTGRYSAGVFWYKIEIEYVYSPPVRLPYVSDFRNNQMTYRGLQDPEDDESEQAQARRRIKTYPVGKRVWVYYNPQDPHIAVLQPGETIGTFGGSLLGLFGAVAGVFLALCVPMLIEKLCRRLAQM